jgi:hypothetical protein
MKGLSIALIVALLLFGCDKPEVTNHPHYHAGFQVYKQNQLQDFSDLKYMHLESCTETEAFPKAIEDEQIEKAHLHNGVGDVVHVHRDNSVWGDLFHNLNYPLEASATAYLNSKPVVDFLTLPIEPYDTLVVVQGEASNLDQMTLNVPTREYIETVEAQSETSGEK